MSDAANAVRVGCPDPWAPEIQREILAAAPDGFVVTFADPKDRDAWQGVIADSEFLLLAATHLTAEHLAHAKRVRLIQRWGIGVDNVDLQAAQRAGIGVAITAGANAHTVAEHTIMLMLATLRRLSLADRALREGRWLFKEMRAQCLQLTGRTVGLVGLGNIGRAVARRLQGFETRIIYYDPRRASAEIEAQLGAELLPFEQVLAEADVLSLHCPSGAENHHMIDAAAFARMRRGAVLINAARGELVDPDALYEALTTGSLMGAGLDVFEPEPPVPSQTLLALDNVTLTPHTAASVFDNVARVARHAFGNMQRVLRNEAIPEADLVLPPRRT